MTNIIICGAGGKMGKVVAMLSKNYDINVVCGIDAFATSQDFEIYKSFSQCDKTCDVIIDFSRPEALADILDYAKRVKCGLVLATTGYTDSQRQDIENISKTVPVFQTFNFSLGINLLANLARTAAKLLGDNYDIEIIEKHHNQKVDAPSGTAILLGEAINEILDTKKEFIFSRSGNIGKRTKQEIGFSTIRGGNIVGEHDIMFIGANEIITLSHKAQSREVFAEGAIRAALFLNGKPCGKYNMKDLIENAD